MANYIFALKEEGKSYFDSRDNIETKNESLDI